MSFSLSSVCTYTSCWNKYLTETRIKGKRCVLFVFVSSWGVGRDFFFVDVRGRTTSEFNRNVKGKKIFC